MESSARFSSGCCTFDGEYGSIERKKREAVERVEKKNYNGLDLCKFFMMIVVIAIHTGAVPQDGSPVAVRAYSVVSNLAVQSFFLISGFLLGSRMEEPFSLPENRQVLVRYLKRILKMYLTWMLIYTPLTIINYLRHSTPLLKAAVLYLRGLLLMGEQYNSFQLWYLLSTVYALCLLLFLAKRGASLWQAAALGTFLLIPSAFLYWITGARGTLTGTPGKIAQFLYLALGSGRLLLGAFCLPMGMLLAKRPIPNIAAWALLILGAGAMTRQPSGLVFQAMAAIGLVSLLSKAELPDAPVYPALRKMSTAGYLIHMYVYTFFTGWPRESAGKGRFPLPQRRQLPC